KVSNQTSEPHRLIPRFTLVTDKGQSYPDVVIPMAEKFVALRENPTQPLLNSATMSAEPIPPTPKESKPTVRYGVVFWQDVDMSAKSFSVYVEGLSNGYTRQANPTTKKEEVRRKTLVLDFLKPGDVFNPDEKEIQSTNNARWTYR
ncbi:MAG: hypothetical protein ACRC1K_11250, partial [Planctomycetia bacterium]